MGNTVSVGWGKAGFPWGISVPSALFYWEHKTTLKKKVY